MTPGSRLYHGHRFLAAVNAQAIWLYLRFRLSLRMVKEMLAERGLVVSHETIRRWALKLGVTFAAGIGRSRTAARSKWHFDEVAIAISGEQHWLWRAADQHGVVLDVPVRRRRDARAPARWMQKPLRRQRRATRVMITDKLRSDGAAASELMPGVEHRKHKGLNDLAENSHQPAQQRERAMKHLEPRAHAHR